jgi:hypothetical protein
MNFRYLERERDFRDPRELLLDLEREPDALRAREPFLEQNKLINQVKMR